MSRPLGTLARRQLGYAQGYLMLGMTGHALEALAEIPREEADATPVLRVRLALHVERAEWGEAAACAETLCEREPEEAGHWIQWAYATRRHANIAAAREILLRALALHPREATIHFNLACYEAQSGRLDEARDFLAVACALDEGCAEMAKTDPDLEPLRDGAAP